MGELRVGELRVGGGAGGGRVQNPAMLQELQQARAKPHPTKHHGAAPHPTAPNLNPPRVERIALITHAPKTHTTDHSPINPRPTHPAPAPAPPHASHSPPTPTTYPPTIHPSTPLTYPVPTQNPPPLIPAYLGREKNMEEQEAPTGGQTHLQRIRRQDSAAAGGAGWWPRGVGVPSWCRAELTHTGGGRAVFPPQCWKDICTTKACGVQWALFPRTASTRSAHMLQQTHTATRACKESMCLSGPTHLPRCLMGL